MLADRIKLGRREGPTPEVVHKAAEQALAEGRTTYADRRDLPLRTAIQTYHKRAHNLDIDLEWISATSSGMTSIVIALHCLVDPGDNVAVVAPVWPNGVIAIKAMGATVRFVPLEDAAGRWSLGLDRLQSACDDRTRAIFVASPVTPWAGP